MALLARSLVALLALSLADVAGADLRVFKATLTLEGLNPPPLLATSFGVATVNGVGTSNHVSNLALPAGILPVDTSFAISATPSFPVTSVRLDLVANAGNFAGGGGGVLAGPMPLPGMVRLCGLGACTLFLDAPLTAMGTRGVGIGGTVMGAPVVPFGALTLVGGVWQTGMAQIATSAGVVNRTGFAHGPLSATSSTAAPQGVLQLVTPIALKVSSAPGLVNPLFGVLDIKFLPEPGAAALLGSGAALLALAGRRRALRRSLRSR
jgi:hypothetical protein